MLFWSIYNIVVCCWRWRLVSSSRAIRSEERIASSERVQVSAGSFTFTARLSDISVTARRSGHPHPPSPVNSFP